MRERGHIVCFGLVKPPVARGLGKIWLDAFWVRGALGTARLLAGRLFDWVAVAADRQLSPSLSIKRNLLLHEAIVRVNIPGKKRPIAAE